MFALMILLAIGIYLLMSIWIVSLSIGHARKHQLNAKKWGWGAALVMFLIPFWDWLPTVAVHKYCCEKEAGFWVYKTLEQWKAENPGVAETLRNIPPEKYITETSWDGGTRYYLLPDGTKVVAHFTSKGDLTTAEFITKDKSSSGYWLNQRFNWVIKQARYFPLNYMMRREERVVDSKTGEVLARYVDFSASHERRRAGWTGLKFWLDSPHCSGGEINRSSLAHFRTDAEHIGEGAKK